MVGRIIGIVMRWGILIGMPAITLALIGFGVFDIYRTAEFALRGKVGEATVVRKDFRVSYDDGRQTRWDVVFRVDGADRDSAMVSAPEEWGDSHIPGHKIEVIYMPDRPHVARIREFAFNWWSGPILLGCGLGLAFAIWSVLRGPSRNTRGTNLGRGVSH